MRAWKTGRHESEERAEPAGGPARASHTGPHPDHGALLDLQRSVGNRAVCAAIRPAPVQRMNTGVESDAESDLSDSPFHQYISGHGTFSENDLATGPGRSREKSAQFTVPDGMTVYMYAPDGAYLDNAVANRFEKGSPPTVDELELVDMAGRETKPLPQPWPYVFAAGENVIDYRVKPPDRLKVERGPNIKTVDTPTQLRTLVEGAKEERFYAVHYLCCGSALGVSSKFKDLFPESGWYVRLKNP